MQQMLIPLRAIVHAWPLWINMDRFAAGNRAPTSSEGAEMLTRADPALDHPVTPFQEVFRLKNRQNGAGKICCSLSTISHE